MTEKYTGSSTSEMGNKESELNYQTFIRCLADLLESEYSHKNVDKDSGLKSQDIKV